MVSRSLFNLSDDLLWETDLEMENQKKLLASRQCFFNKLITLNKLIAMDGESESFMETQYI